MGCVDHDIQQDCQSDEVEYLETFHWENLESILCALQNIETSRKDVHLVIANQADFEKYFVCNEPLPEIDFEKHFVLAGMYTHHNCAYFDSHEVFKCSDRIRYKVIIQALDCTAITSVYYAAVIEKKYSDLPVDFDVRLKY